MFMLAIQNHPSLEIIDQIFLVNNTLGTFMNRLHFQLLFHSYVYCKCGIDIFIFNIIIIDIPYHIIYCILHFIYYSL